MSTHLCIFYFIEGVRSFSCYFSKFQYTTERPISVADFVGRVHYGKRLISLCLQNLCFFFFFNFDLGEELQPGAPDFVCLW